MKLKKTSAVVLSSAVVFGGLAPAVNAAEIATVESQAVEVEQNETQTTANEDSFTVDELIPRIKELFPEKFESASDENFHLDSSPYFPEEDIERYRVSYFSPESDSDPRHASFEFVGDDLELFNFSIDPQERSEALFPPEVSEDEALNLAKSFMEKMNLDGDFELRENTNIYYNDINRPLTEPIEYQFTFDKLRSGIPIQSQTARVTVLGNGEVTRFSAPRQQGEADFETRTGVMSKDDLLEKLKGDLDVELQYMVRHDYLSQEEEVYLTYRESPAIHEVSAKDGQYYMNGEYVDEIPEEEDIQMLADQAKATSPITKDEAEELARELLATDDENTTLHIDRITERENPDGTEVYSISYMYRTGNSGYGSSIEINKNTGELVRYHNSRGLNPNEEVDENVSYEEALDLAVDYISDYAYSNMDEYAYPVNRMTTVANDREHRFTFPRVKDGLVVAGDRISVGISKEDGSLASLSVNYSNFDDWPSAEEAVSQEQALEDIKSKLDLKLYYVDRDRDSNEQTLQYKLNYLRNDNEPTFYNAVTGEWESNSPFGQKEDVVISHPWAEEELNFMISNNILEIDDPANFDADQAVTKGEALEILTKSIDRVYPRPPVNEEREQSPFSNIDSEHELYNIIMQSVQRGIVDDSQDTFDVDSPLTRENLAFWYVRALDLDSVAKRSEIFSYNFNDLEDMSDEYRGYVVLANSLGLLTNDGENNFLPQQEVTYAQLAVANLRLAQLITSGDFR
ncbi:PepSY1/2 domain-containing protein [Tenuibacillus multivorans]|uniref:S-layer homology domain-containing protein n=1 Tax=Tenuibacillus multivorans TaxID=237069 RepID=A0A1H0EBL7_9BACI|nr:PepSY1/2 domain-containing protein [Tenuibacillus multivorans]GEL78746.1 hypothetical protein TMU01_29810 [Tenuibacillus multivorans]SDN79847.1 S-layer homology domain-containing protein [Tenuibacillus multivorans]